MNDKIESDYTRRLAGLLDDSGFKDFELVSSLPIDQVHLGNMQATFRIELILFRSSLDKGEHHVDIAGATPPTRFYPIEVIGIAFGWWKAEEIMERTGVPSPEESIGALKSHFEEVSAAFQPAMLQHTLKKLEHADTLMQEAMSKHWAGLQKR